MGDLLEGHIDRLVSGIDATLAVDATIRASVDESALELGLPILSIEMAGPDAGEGPAAGADLQILGILGRGGMGVVFAARQRALDRDVAIKRPLGVSVDLQQRAALLGEARTMGTLEHPNIVPVHALGTDRAGSPILVMKRIEGVSWRELLSDAAQPMWDKLGSAKARGLAFHVEVLMQVCNALHFAHSRGIVHRDIKPENVMIGAFGEIYVLDWGLATKIGGEGSTSIVGTPSYMAPEMVLEPASADAQTDVFLLGAVLHELLVGRPLNVGTSLPEVFHSILSPAPFEYPPSAPADLVALCQAATQRERDERLPSCAAFRDGLAAHAAHRASHQLAATASSKLDDLEARLGEHPTELGSLEIGVLLAECRFGFEQSLREWPENEFARRGLSRCLARAIQRELSLRNGSAARALCAALPTRDEALEARVEVLERELAEARALELANAERALDLDASVSAWPRVVALVGFLVVGGGVSLLAYFDEQTTGDPLSVADQLMLDGTIGGTLLVGLVIGRKRLLANAYNRNLWGLFALSIVTITIYDAYLGSLGVGPAEATAIDFALFATVFATGALTFSRSLAWTALISATAAVVAGLAPTLATPAATLALFLMIGLLIVQSRRAAQGVSATGP